MVSLTAAASTASITSPVTASRTYCARTTRTTRTMTRRRGMKSLLLPTFAVVLLSVAFGAGPSAVVVVHAQEQQQQGGAGGGSVGAAGNDDNESSSGIDLGGGVVTRTDVSVYADLALDVRDIRTYADTDQKDAARSVYSDGFHAAVNAGSRFPLQRLSTELSGTADKSGAARTPNYLYHLYGLSGRSHAAADLEANAKYAHAFVEETMNAQLYMAADAVVALHMWMYGTHLLWTAVDQCRTRTAAADPAFVPSPETAWDAFIALWIGRDQTPAAAGAGAGHGLYAWAQDAGTAFQTADPEAAANSKLKLLYQQGATALAVPAACTGQNRDTVRQLYTVAAEMTNQMMVPAFQSLILAIVRRDGAAAALRAAAVVPQLSACRASVYKRLKENLLDAEQIDFAKSEEYLRDVREAMRCFALTCADIGSYHFDSDGLGNSFRCIETARFIGVGGRPLAGYQPGSDVEALSRMDLDVYQMYILALQQSYGWAEMLYRYGSNVPADRTSPADPVRFLSLRELATSNDRAAADPVYSQFLRYYNDKTYADTTMSAALAEGGSSKWSGIEQRAETAAMTAVTQVVYLQIVAQLNAAVAVCEQADPESGISLTEANPWDKAAALLIGSMEGTVASLDLDDGQFFWNLANRRAFQFHSITATEDASNSNGLSVVAGKFQDLLFAGRGEMEALDCAGLDRTADEIQRFMAVPVMQSAIRAAAAAQQLLADSTDPALARAESYAVAVLPLINDADESAAALIRENLVVKENVKPVRDGVQKVAEAFGDATVNAFRLRCQYLGATSDVDPCTRFGGKEAGLGDHGGTGDSVTTGAAASSSSSLSAAYTSSFLTAAATAVAAVLLW